MSVLVHFRREQRGDDDEPLCGKPSKRADLPEMTGEKADVTCWRCIMLVLGRALPAEPALPEHKRLEAAKSSGRDATQMLGEFLNEFLPGENVHLCRIDGTAGEFYNIHESRQLIAKFFGINENALESEKMALLDYQRKINAASEWALSEGRDALKRP